MAYQTHTPIHLQTNPSKDRLLDAFKGKSLDELRTPAFIIDRNVFAQNCANMHSKAREWGVTFRAHLKTHKTAEGATLQLRSTENQTHAVVVSTMMEAWEVVRAGLVANGTVNDILYGMPVAVNKVDDLASLRRELEAHGGAVKLLVDHPDQVKFLEKYESSRETPKRWLAFVKINGGQNRAGVYPDSPALTELVKVILASPAVTLHGFYGHAGNSYASTSLSEASAFLSGEVQCVNIAAKSALDLLKSGFPEASVSKPFVLSVGSTPTAHAASAEAKKLLSEVLHGALELHAGNYPMLDLQQQHTSLIDHARIAQRVRATVVSYYPGRGADGRDEALVDAGAIAFSKDTGPFKVFGEVIGRPWTLSRISQEHGVLVCNEAPGTNKPLELGTVVEIIGQHACLIAAAYPWYYIVDSGVEDGKKVVDIWVPWKGW
ncbi:hypothetical protein D9619_003555 [Psilocybe cf. subviscida]|uniref:D-serine dehydratase n=1 Tax=Psilocybe cf. subviscida TaxID=2480587 RepID=A0A8H5AXY8_9AGAR|nr:hypothetical protein D9619_003555 [Psilocybe cf. subviscida]